MPQISQVKLSATHNVTLKYFKHLSELKILFFGQCIDTPFDALESFKQEHDIELTCTYFFFLAASVSCS